MNSINYIVGAEIGSSIDQVLFRLGQEPTWRPLDQRAIDFVNRFSQKLLTAQGVKIYPELVALGYWFRGAHLKKLFDTPLNTRKDAIQLGRGLAFHLAPSNVDSVFMYSCLLSLLAGNSNLVRVSMKFSDAFTFLISVLKETLEEPVGKPIRPRIVLLTYPHNEELTRNISEACFVRVIWGGDDTVKAIRLIPLRPTATEICFPDRFSVCALNAKVIIDASDIEMLDLVSRFYNDAFWFSQQACSSPRLVAWVGSNEEIESASKRFWTDLTKVVLKKNPENTEAMNMARIAACFEYAAHAIARPNNLCSCKTESFINLKMDSVLNKSAKDIHCGNGLFLEVNLRDLLDLVAYLTDKEQTLTVHGFETDELIVFAESLPPRAVDRITNVGDALAFTPVWDGYDLLVSFSRILILPAQ